MEMNQKEKFLTTYVEKCTKGNYKLHKFYRENEERSDVPDIWDTITTITDRVEAEYEAAPDDAKQQKLDKCHRAERFVDKSQALYFAFCEHSHKVLEVVRRTVPIYKAQLVDNKIQLTQSTENIDVWRVGKANTNWYTYEEDYIVVDPTALSVGKYYAFNGQDMETILAWANLDYERHTCKDCGKVFSIHAQEKKFYESKGMALPKRCEDCRKKRRATKNTTG